MTRLIDGMHQRAQPLTRAAADYDPLLERIGEARFVLLGEASLGEDPQAYGYVTSFNLRASCESEVINQLVELRRRAAEYATAGWQPTNTFTPNRTRAW